MTIRPQALTAAVLGLAVALSACGFAGDADTSLPPDAAAERAPVEEAGDEQVAAGAGGGRAAEPESSGQDPDAVDESLLAGRDLIRTGTVTVSTDDVLGTAAKARVLVSGAGGVVAGDEVSIDSDAPVATLTFRVPPARFDTLADELGDLGTLLRRQSSTEDVTATRVDLDARISGAEASLKRMQALFERAGSVEELARLEAELSSRETELERLKTARANLADRIGSSTLIFQVVGSKDAALPELPEEDEGPDGFVDGWKTGFSGLARTVGVLVTVVGVLLPWLLSAGIPILVAALAFRRYRRRHPRRPRPPRPTPPASPAPSGPAPGTPPSRPPGGTPQPPPLPTPVPGATPPSGSAATPPPGAPPEP